MNRVDDSLQLFKQICSNPLLKNAHLVLFLSLYCSMVALRFIPDLAYADKADVLASKLAKGVRVNK